MAEFDKSASEPDAIADSRSAILGARNTWEIVMHRAGQFVVEYHHGRCWWRLVIPPWVLRWMALLLLASQGGGALWWTASDILRAAALL